MKTNTANLFSVKRLLVVFLATTATVVLADVPANVAQPYDGSGAYLNLNAGIGTMQNVTNSSFALGGNAGYNFNRGFAVEGGMTMLPSQQSGQLSTYSLYDAAVKGTIPLSNVFSLYGRLGAAMGYSSWSGATNSPAVYQTTGSAYNYGGLAGVGGSFVLSRHFDLRVEDYAYIPVNGQGGNFGGVNVVTGGVQYNF